MRFIIFVHYNRLWRGIAMVVIHKKHKETPEEKETREKIAAAQKMGIQDEYQAKGFELVSWVQDHKNMVMGLIIAVFVFGALLL